MLRSMNGKALPLDSPEMNAMLSYMAWLSKGVPTGVSVAGRGFKRLIPQRPSDPVQGQRLYIAQCALCHGVDGQGMVSPNNTYGFPALWGHAPSILAQGWHDSTRPQRSSNGICRWGKGEVSAIKTPMTLRFTLPSSRIQTSLARSRIGRKGVNLMMPATERS